MAKIIPITELLEQTLRVSFVRMRCATRYIGIFKHPEILGFGHEGRTDLKRPSC